MATKAAKIPEWKKKAVVALTKELPNYKTIAVINLSGLPSKQYQTITRKLKDKLTVKYSKKVIAVRAIDAVKNETLKKLTEHMLGIPALVLTNEDAFALASIFKKNQSPAYAKAGQESPEDIWIKAGPTPFAPGPAIAEFAQLKIKAGVEGGKIAVKQDSLVVKKGETFSPLAASMLARLNITPMKLGIKLVAAVEGSEFYLADVLDVDEEKYINNLKTAALDSFALAVELGIMNSETAEFLVSKAARDAKALAEETNILTEETASHILAKAEVGANALNANIPKITKETKTQESTSETPVQSENKDPHSVESDKTNNKNKEGE